jgi:hypothetical protein
MRFGNSLPCVNISARQRVVVRVDKKHTAKAHYRAKRCRAAFVVHFREKRTAKSLSCILVFCRAPETHGKGSVFVVILVHFIFSSFSSVSMISSF